MSSIPAWIGVIFKAFEFLREFSFRRTKPPIYPAEIIFPNQNRPDAVIIRIDATGYPHIARNRVILRRIQQTTAYPDIYSTPNRPIYTYKGTDERRNGSALFNLDSRDHKLMQIARLEHHQILLNLEGYPSQYCTLPLGDYVLTLEYVSGIGHPELKRQLRVWADDTLLKSEKWEWPEN